MYLRLSGFYLCYFAALGALLPYWALYLRGQGFDARAIGELMALMMATKIVAPNIWGWLADYSGRRVAIIQAASLAAAVCFAAVLLVSSYAGLAAVMVAFSFFWNAALPQFEAVTMNYLGNETHRYSAIRLWGSLGFILSVVALGPLLDRYGANLLPPVLILLFSFIWLFSLGVPARLDDGTRAPPGEPLLRVLRRPAVAALLFVCFLMQLSHGPYYTFFSIYLDDNGYSGGLIGILWAWGVVAEIGVFLLMHRLLPGFGLRRLLLASFGLATLRWLLLAFFVSHPLVVLLAQTLHAASFGVYHAVAITLIHRLFTGRNQGRGQALYSSVSFGAGGAVGSLGAGYLWEGSGAAATFLAATLASALALVVAVRLVDGAGVATAGKRGY